MKNPIPQDRRKYWTAGLAVSSIGMVFYKFSSAIFSIKYEIYFVPIGRILLLCGLLIIMFGTAKSLKQT